MSSRTTALVGVVAFALLAALVAAVSARGGEDAPSRQPPSSYLTGPGGASGLAEGLERLGIGVTRWRRPWRSLKVADTIPSLFVVLDPSRSVTWREASRLVARSRSTGPVLIAGSSARSVLNCWGWRVEPRGRDSIRVTRPGVPPPRDAAYVTEVLVRGLDPSDSVDLPTPGDVGRCKPVTGRLDTLLVTAGNRPVLVRVTPEKGFPAYLASEGALFSNRSMRATAMGPFLLGLLHDQGPTVLFDEYSHGYDEGGGLFSATLAWSTRSPWGWAAWQLAVVGLLALVVAMVRTGPIHSVIRRARRSPLEHVRAVATALHAARGHDVAVELLVRGLRRRLSRDGRPGREPAAEWLSTLTTRARSPRVRAAAARLRELTRPRRSVDDVLAAANAVEEVWQELRP